MRNSRVLLSDCFAHNKEILTEFFYFPLLSLAMLEYKLYVDIDV